MLLSELRERLVKELQVEKKEAEDYLTGMIDGVDRMIAEIVKELENERKAAETAKAEANKRAEAAEGTDGCATECVEAACDCPHSC